MKFCWKVWRYVYVTILLASVLFLFFFWQEHALFATSFGLFAGLVSALLSKCLRRSAWFFSGVFYTLSCLSAFFGTASAILAKIGGISL